MTTNEIQDSFSEIYSELASAAAFHQAFLHTYDRDRAEWERARDEKFARVKCILDRFTMAELLRFHDDFERYHQTETANRFLVKYLLGRIVRLENSFRASAPSTLHHPHQENACGLDYLGL